MRAKSRRQKQNGADFAAWIQIWQEIDFRPGVFCTSWYLFTWKHSYCDFEPKARLHKFSSVLSRLHSETAVAPLNPGTNCNREGHVKQDGETFNIPPEMQYCACQLVAVKLRKQHAQGKPPIDPFTALQGFSIFCGYNLKQH